jgi:signal transduction histidine kinase
MAEKADALLRRLDTAFARERRTTADIAHELRTPISEMLIVSEVALRDGRDADGLRRALATVRDVASRMGRSVSTLLKLARLDMGAETFDRADVDLGRIVRELLRSLSAVERERGLRLDNRIEVSERVEADADVLRIVVSNLLSNALHYSPPHGRVECRLERRPEQWRFVVENAAADLRAEDLSALTEAFWRKDRSRSDSDRSGLGLALSRALAEKAGMELAFELENATLRSILTGAIASNGHDRSASIDRLAATPSGTRDVN